MISCTCDLHNDKVCVENISSITMVIKYSHEVTFYDNTIKSNNKESYTIKSNNKESYMVKSNQKVLFDNDVGLIRLSGRRTSD